MKIFLIGFQSSPEVTQAVRAALISNGYSVVSDVKDPHDLTATLTATSAVEASLFAVEVNGVRQQKFKYNVTLVVSSDKDKQSIDSASTQFVSKREEVTPATVQALINTLSSNGKLTQYATSIKDKEAANQKAAADAVERQNAAEIASIKHRVEEKRLADEASWKASGAEDCGTAKRADACVALTMWMGANRENPHVTEADDVVKKSAAQIATLREEEGWKTTTADTWKSPKTGADCASIEAYIAAFPEGAHAKEAKEILSKSAAKVAALRKAEAQRAEAVEKAEEQRAEAVQKKEEKEECKRSCKADLQWRVMHPQYQTLLGRCIQNKCN